MHKNFNDIFYLVANYNLEKTKGVKLRNSVYASSQITVSQQIFMILSQLDLDNDTLNDKKKASALSMIFRLGMLDGMMSAQKMILNEKLYEIHKIVYSTVGKKHQNKRWDEVNEFKRKLAEEAENKWANGDDALHNDMAEYLMNLYERKYPKYKKPFYQKAIIEVARKYNRVKGEKGVKKIINYEE